MCARSSPVAEILATNENGEVSNDMVVYSTRLLSLDTWDDFASLVQADNGVWGGPSDFLRTGEPGRSGFGFTFTIGRGNDLRARRSACAETTINAYAFPRGTYWASVPRQR